MSSYLSLVEQDVGFLLMLLMNERAVLKNCAIISESAVNWFIWTIVMLNAGTDGVSYQEIDCC